MATERLDLSIEMVLLANDATTAEELMRMATRRHPDLPSDVVRAAMRRAAAFPILDRCLLGRLLLAAADSDWSPGPRSRR